jgi:hypothetical protein
MTLVLMMANSNRFPVSTKNPARPRNGSPYGRIISRSRLFPTLDVGRQALAGRHGGGAVDAANLQYLPKHCGHAASPVEPLAQVTSGRLHVDQKRDGIGLMPRR